MTIFNRKEPLILFLGDLLAFALALWLTLFFRYGGNLPESVVGVHFQAFSILFVVWLLVFYIAGLYGKRTILFKSRLPKKIFQAQLVNSVLAVLFFYLIPYFGIAPKTNLFVCLVISFLLILIWRFYGESLLGPRHRQKGIIIGAGGEFHELAEEINNNNRYAVIFDSVIDLETSSDQEVSLISQKIETSGASIVVADFRNQKIQTTLPELYRLVFNQVKFVDFYRLYEDIFDRIPLSLVKHSWFLANISFLPSKTYDGLKRIMDIILASIIGVISLLLYPFVYVAIKTDDGGKVFISQKRVGRGGKSFEIFKFRTMTRDDGGKDSDKNGNHITKIGNFLRKTRIDELPQLWNVLMGDLSLIGPRPELPILAEQYKKEIPYYDVRHLIKPGLSGWAQLNQSNPPKRDLNFNDTKVKLSYDLFYLKNRSLMLDIKIILRTVATLLSRSGL